MIRLKSWAREAFPRPYFWLQAVVGRLATWLLKREGIELPPYFLAPHRIALMFRPETDPEVIRIAEKLVAEGETVLDVGANVGLISRQFARLVGPGGSVLSFEPDEKTAFFLKRNTRNLPQVRIFGVALSDKNGTARFFLDPRSGTSNSLAEREVKGEVVAVPCQTMDDFLAENPVGSVSLIKIDVEGAEPLVLRGMNETLQKQCGARIIIEFSPDNLKQAGFSPHDLFEPLKSQGFAAQIVLPDGELQSAPDPETVIRVLPESGYVNLLWQRF